MWLYFSFLSVGHCELCRDDIRGFPWEPQSSLTLWENANEYWQVDFAYLNHSPCTSENQLVLWEIWGLKWELSAGPVPTDLSLLPQQLFCVAPRWFCCAVSRRAQRFIRRADRGSDVDRGIGGWANFLLGWRFSGTALFGCRGRHRIGPRVVGHAFPGHREHRAGGMYTSHALPWFLSSRKCMRSRWSRGRLLLMTRSGSSAFPILATFDGGAQQGLRWQRGLSERRCPHFRSKSAICCSAWLRRAMLTKCAFSMLPSPRLDCSATLLWTLPRSSRQYRSRPRHILPPVWCTICHRSATGQAPVCSSRWAPFCVLQSCPCLIVPHVESSPRLACWASRGSMVPPCPSWSDIILGGDKAALTQTTRRCRKLLDLRRWRGQCRSFPRRRSGGESFHIPPLAQDPGVTTFSGSQTPGLTVCDVLPPHSRLWCPFCQQPRDCSWETRWLSTHLWPVHLGTWGVQRGCIRTRCLHMSIVPLVPLAQSLGVWLALPNPSLGMGIVKVLTVLLLLSVLLIGSVL